MQTPEAAANRERVQFFNGQRLFASDLQDIESFHRQMRELHNRSLHQAGVGSGFAVSGAPGDRTVIVGPGYAIDSNGHEIVHTVQRHEPVPPVAGDADGNPTAYYLTVSYDERPEEAETRQGVCTPRGVVRLREEPVFCWVRLERGEEEFTVHDERLRRPIEQGEKIILAQIEVQNCRLHSLSIAQRRNARPATQPFIACGTEEDVDWKFKTLQKLPGVDRGGIVFAELTADVNTEQIRFRTEPCYTARIEGDRTFKPDTTGLSAEFIAEGVVSIASASTQGFAVRVMALIGWRGSEDPFPDRPPESGEPSDLDIKKTRLVEQIFNDRWSIVWMGIE